MLNRENERNSEDHPLLKKKNLQLECNKVFYTKYYHRCFVVLQLNSSDLVTLVVGPLSGPVVDQVVGKVTGPEHEIFIYHSVLRSSTKKEEKN